MYVFSVLAVVKIVDCIALFPQPIYAVNSWTISEKIRNLKLRKNIS